MKCSSKNARGSIQKYFTEPIFGTKNPNGKVVGEKYTLNI